MVRDFDLLGTVTKQKNLPQKQKCIIRRWMFCISIFTMPGGGGVECKEQYTKRVLKETGSEHTEKNIKIPAFTAYCKLPSYFIYKSI